MKHVIALGLAATTMLAGPLWAAELKQVGTIEIPGEKLTTFDISYIDPSSGLYYFADRSNKGIDVFDTKTDTFVGRVGSFVGVAMKDGKPDNDASGPDGVLFDGKAIWAGDGDSTLKIIDPSTQDDHGDDQDRGQDPRRRDGLRPQGRGRHRRQQRRGSALRDARVDQARPHDPRQGRL